MGYLAHEATAGEYRGWGLGVPVTEDGPTLSVPADGKTYSWSQWDNDAPQNEEFSWGTIRVNPNGSYTTWSWPDGTMKWGRINGR